jgi:hypothetical protein
MPGAQEAHREAADRTRKHQIVFRIQLKDNIKIILELFKTAQMQGVRAMRNEAYFIHTPQ